MTAEANKKLVRRYGHVWHAGNQHLVDELAAPDLVVYYPLFGREVRGHAAFKQVLTGTHVAFPDVQLVFEELLAEGDAVVARWRATATSRGAFAGRPPTGQRVEWTGMTLYRIAGGKVIEERGEEDALGLFRQLGALPVPGATG
ncbi:MAG TPA: ester cyclase [Nitrolancea sp.]|nr:ester cyclase [Nitrolancea sp.]